MVVPDEQDGKSEDCLAFAVQSNNANEENTRKGGMQSVVKVIEKVIVDMREFRSELPAILYTRGIKIEPVTLVVSEKLFIDINSRKTCQYKLIIKLLMTL